MLMCTPLLCIFSYLQQRPSLETVISWIDFDTVVLLFGMMVMVGILADTGAYSLFPLADELSYVCVWGGERNARKQCEKWQDG